MTQQLADVYRIDHFIDTFALGHYARVLDAHDRRTGETIAFKVLRPEHLQGADAPKWEFRAFIAEADLLMRLADSPHVIDLLDCGYIEAAGEAPVGGGIQSHGRDVLAFARGMEDAFARRWRPYLALHNLPRTENLFYQMRPDKPGARLRLPTEEGLALALQFAETLRLAHRQQIVYLDHKLEHLYWDGVHLRIIDLNSSRLLTGGDRASERMYAVDVHNLCVGILYPLFTGLSPQKTAIRPQPGSMSDVEARYQEVTTLDFGVEPSLSPALQTLLQRGAAHQIATIDQFITELQAVAALHGWDFPRHYTSPDSREVRARMREGIARIRQGQDALREARDLFREAAIQDGISDDLDAELRRLVKAVSDMLQNRVVP
jgi:serine/threonine protein kinase